MTMITRRNLLSMSAAFAATPLYSNIRIQELETRIAKRDFRGISKDDLPTPCMVLELDKFERNLLKMASHTKTTGINVRPHVKIHKCVEVSKRQMALGAVGVCCATMAEAEMVSAAGVKGALLTCQPAGRNKIQRTAALAKKDSTFHCVVDDPITAGLLEEAAAAEKVTIKVGVDVFAGLSRQGCQPGKNALELAQKIHASKNLKLAGFMGYSGDASHTHGFEARKIKSAEHLSGLMETVAMARKSGLPVGFITGGSTGTYNIDVGSLTELQAGSYIFMDTAYVGVGGKSNEHVYEDWEPALTVLTTVVSKTRAQQCSIDAGNKAMLKTTDEVKGRPNLTIQNQGAEYGILLWNEIDPGVKLGERVEIYPSNLDTSVNVYDRIFVTRGDDVLDVWSIMGRTGAAQR